MFSYNFILFAQRASATQPSTSTIGAILLDFVLSVLASLLAAILLIALGSFFSRRARWVFTALFSRLLDVDLEYVFSNKSEAQTDIDRELRKASFIRLCTGRGNELQRGAFLGILNQNLRGNEEFKVLLPKVDPTPGSTDWVEQREAELAMFDPAFGNGVLKKQIQMTIDFLGNYVTKGDVELRFFELPHIGRFLITDRVAYFTPYDKRDHGRNSRIFKHRHGGEMYYMLTRLFDQLWDVSAPFPINETPDGAPYRS